MIRFVLIAVVGLATVTQAQELPPGGDDWNLPPIGAEPTEEEANKQSSWMVNSPLMRIGWPQFRMPEAQFPTLRRNPETGEPGLLTRPLVRAQSATRAIATRTRDTWNGAVERVKLNLPGSGTANQVAENEPRQRFWSSWFGEQQQTDSDDLGTNDLSPNTVPELMASEPAASVR